MCPQTYAQFKTSCATKIQDASSTNFTTGEWDTFILDATREAAQYVPHLSKVSFNIESRTGQATATSAGNLVDTTESQFVAGDVGKEVYNTTDKTWAIITGFTSSSEVALSVDIMASGENYKIFNAGCSSNKQIDISGVVSDYLGVDSVEYPVGTRRNWTVEGNVLTIKVDSVDDSKAATSGAQPNTEVVVRFSKRHLISQLTDLAGAIAGTMAIAGTTSIALSSLQTAGTIEVGQEFTISNVRGTYTVTGTATIASNTVTISFFPGLASSAANTTAVTLTQSTLTPILEPLVQDLAVALAGDSKPMALYQTAFTSITTAGLAATAIALVGARINAGTASITLANSALLAATVAIAAITTRIAAGTADITTGLTYAATAGTSSIPSATTEIAKIVTEVTLAASALASATSLINTIPVGGGAGEWMGQAVGDLGVAQGRTINGQTWLQKAASELTVANSYFTAAGLEQRGASERAQEANVNHANAGQYLNSASLELRGASTRIEEANASFRKATHELQIVNSGRVLEAYAKSKLAEARNKLRAVSGHSYSTRCTRE